METQFKLTAVYKITAIALITVGLAALIFGLYTAPVRTWANILLNNYYFLSLAIGGTFFLAIQSISQAGWSAQFKRVPEAMGAYLPIAFLVLCLMAFGLHDIYHWTHEEAINHDPLLAHKTAYLNIPFLYIRLLLFFGAWIALTQHLRKLSLKEDLAGGLVYAEKTEFFSKVYIFVLAISFSALTFDWVMSIDVHWYSTIFALKNFVSAFYHGSVVIALLVILLHKAGYFPKLNKSHLLDFSRYIFMLCIIWGWFWFAQFMLIWYANLPEETLYYALRWEGAYKPLFFLNIGINWFVPFVVLMSRHANRKPGLLIAISILLIAGHWIDLYMQIMPGTLAGFQIGWIEAGSFIAFAGLFMAAFGWRLKQAPIIPKNHPYLEESLNHHVH